MIGGTATTARAVARRSLLALAGAVAIGCLALGAPPRMETVEGAPRWLAVHLETLLPLLVLQLVIALHFAQWIAGAPHGRWRGARRDLGLPLAILAGLAVVQLLPGSALVLDLVAPGIGEVREGLGLPGSAPFTPWPYGTWTALVTLAGVLVVQRVVLVAVAADDEGRRTARRLLGFVLAVAALECGIGIASTHLGDDSILGLAKVSGRGRVTGTFVLAPMLGVWAGMGACAGVGLAALAAGRGARRAAVACGVLAALCGAGAVLSLSRVMLAATAAGLVVTLWCVAGALRASGRTRGATVLRAVVVLVPVGALAAALLVPSLRERMAFAVHYLTGEPGPVEPRIAGWISTWDLFRESPLVGTGLGSFGRAVHLTQSVDAPQEMWFTHGDPLNLLADAGVLGFLLVAAWLVGCWRHGRAALRAADVETRLLAAAAWGGAVVVLVGSLADFQTQFPVVALPFAALAALPAALAAPPVAADAAPPWGRGRWRVVPFVIVAVVAVVLAGVRRDRAAHVAAGHPPAPTAGEMALAAARTRLTTIREATDPAAELEAARELLAEAVAREPFLDEAHLWRALAELSAPDGDRELALVALGRARLVSRGHAGVNLQVGLLYLDLIGTDPAPHGPPGDTGMDALREAGALVPQAFSRAFAEARARGLDGEDLARVVPDRAHALTVFADHLAAAGDAAGARAAERRALEAEPWDPDLAGSVAASHAGTADEDAARALFDRLRLEWPPGPMRRRGSARTPPSP